MTTAMNNDNEKFEQKDSDDDDIIIDKENLEIANCFKHNVEEIKICDKCENVGNSFWHLKCLQNVLIRNLVGQFLISYWDDHIVLKNDYTYGTISHLETLFFNFCKKNCFKININQARSIIIESKFVKAIKKNSLACYEISIKNLQLYQKSVTDNNKTMDILKQSKINNQLENAITKIICVENITGISSDLFCKPDKEFMDKFLMESIKESLIDSNGTFPFRTLEEKFNILWKKHYNELALPSLNKMLKNYELMNNISNSGNDSLELSPDLIISKLLKTVNKEFERKKFQEPTNEIIHVEAKKKDTMQLDGFHQPEKHLVGKFLLELSDKKLLTSNNLIAKQMASSEFLKYCAKNGYKSKKSLGQLLESCKYLHSGPKNPLKRNSQYHISITNLNEYKKFIQNNKTVVNSLEKHCVSKQLNGYLYTSNSKIKNYELTKKEVFQSAKLKEPEKDLIGQFLLEILKKKLCMFSYQSHDLIGKNTVHYEFAKYCTRHGFEVNKKVQELLNLYQFLDNIPNSKKGINNYAISVAKINEYKMSVTNNDNVINILQKIYGNRENQVAQNATHQFIGTCAQTSPFNRPLALQGHPLSFNGFLSPHQNILNTVMNQSPKILGRIPNQCEFDAKRNVQSNGNYQMALENNSHIQNKTSNMYKTNPELLKNIEKHIIGQFLIEILSQNLFRANNLISKIDATDRFSKYCEKYGFLCYTPLHILLQENGFTGNCQKNKLKLSSEYNINLMNLRIYNETFTDRKKVIEVLKMSYRKDTECDALGYNNNQKLFHEVEQNSSDSEQEQENKHTFLSENDAIGSFLYRLLDGNLIDSMGLAIKSVVQKEFRIFCKKNNVFVNEPLGSLLEKHGFLYVSNSASNFNNILKTDANYELSLEKINKHAAQLFQNNNSIKEKESSIINALKNDMVKKNQPLSEQNEDNIEFEENSDASLIYNKTWKQKLNSDFSPSNMSCFVCQNNFRSKNDLLNHIKEIHSIKEDNHNSNAAGLLKSVFKLSYFTSKTSFLLKFKLESEENDVIIDKIITIRSGEFVSLNWLSSNPKYFYGDQHLFNIGMKQPIMIIFSIGSNSISKIVEEHHFLRFDQFPQIGNMNFKSLKVFNRSELIIKKSLKKYYPKEVFRKFVNKDYENFDMSTVDTEMREFLDNNKTLNPRNYLGILSKLLQMEDTFIMNEYRLFDQHNISFKSRGRECSLNLTNIPKSRRVDEIIKPFDTIVLKLTNERQPGEEQVKFHGRVWKVYNNSTICFEYYGLDLSKEILDVHFEPSRLTMRYQYQALGLMEEKLIRRLFPIVNMNRNPAHVKLNIINDAVANNPEQLQAVMNIIDGPNECAPYIIFGPPGTGKTTTLVESIMQLLITKPDCRILVTAGSNAACNEVGQRLTKILAYERPDEISLLRIFSATAERYSDIIEDTDPAFFEASNHCHGSHFYPALSTLTEYKIIVATLAVIGKYVLGDLKYNFFTHIFVDECAASTEPECLVGIAGILSENTRLILSGDPKQLGAVIFSNRVQDVGFGKSLMERLLERQIYEVDEKGDYDRSIQTRLIRNYRSNEKIVNIFNYLYYNMDLISSAPKELTDWAEGWGKLPNKKIPIIFHNIYGECRKNYGETSSYNTQEINLVMDYVKEIMTFGINSRNIKEKDIGIITPYRKQYELINERLAEKKLSNIDTGSAEIFQGHEKPIIIMSMVKSFKNVGFLVNDKRLNVMLSRPQALLIIIGNQQTLCEISAFKYVIDYCKKNNCFIDGNSDFTKRMNDLSI